MPAESEKDAALITVDLNDEVTRVTLHFISKVIGQQFFEIIDGEVTRPVRPSSQENAADGNQYPCTSNQVLPGRVINPQNQIQLMSTLGDSSKTALDTITSLTSSQPLLCHLPVLQLPQNSFVHYAGLCTVVRNMVHYVHECDPGRKAISLLGDKETCLKSYAEVSNWTQFCENELPKSARSLCKMIENAKADHVDIPSIPQNIQNVLQKIDRELQTAKNIKNKHKYLGKERTKWLMKLVDETFEGQYFQGKLSNEYVGSIINGLDAMWSPYLGGFQMTVADLIAASMILQILVKLSSLVDMKELEAEVPLAFRWLKQMLKVPVVKSSAESSWETVLNFNDDLMDEEKSQSLQSWKRLALTVDPVSQTKLEQKNSKMKVQHQNEITKTLIKVEESGLLPKLSDWSCSCPEINWDELPSDLNPSKGDLNLGRTLRKQRQIENLLAAVKPLAKPGHRIVDFCAGGGHVGIVLAYFLPFCEVVLVENKEQSVSRAVSRIRSLGFKNIRICHSNLDYFCGRFDIGVTLHACGVATDLVLNTCARERALFVVCPCCYGGIGILEGLSYPRSNEFRSRICLEDYLVLSHAADMTTWDQNSTKHRLATSSMALIDSDRCAFMEEQGYATKLIVMDPSDCTPKNHVLIGELPP